MKDGGREEKREKKKERRKARAFLSKYERIPNNVCYNLD